MMREGTNKIIRDGINGVLIEHDGNKVFALASGLRQLMADRRKMRRLGKNGVLRPATYEIDNVLDTWQDVLKLVGEAS